jgi:mRNA-degrading endonuclease RelE of RelBE toxin-antitoxin system
MEIISPHSVAENLSTLPPEAQKQVVDFIAFLKTRYKPTVTSKKLKTGLLEDEAFVGMWRNRQDMQDSNEWVRNLRHQEWG